MSASDQTLRSGLVAIGLAAVALWLVFSHDVPFVGGEKGRLVRATFASATQVDDRTPVRVGGVDVGKVERVDLHGDAARVTMRITDDGVVVRRDARAAVRWRTLLGGTMYIDLQPGSPSAPPLGDAAIPASRTQTQVEFDQLDQVLDGTTADAQRASVRALAEGLRGDGAGNAIDALSPALQTVQRGFQPLQGEDADDLSRLVRSTGRTLRALAVDTRRLQGLASSAATTFETTASRRADLGAWLQRMPATLDSTRSALTRLRRSSDVLEPLLRRLRPGARALAPSTAVARPAITTADDLLARAQPLARDLRPTARALATLAATGRPLVRELTPTVRRVDEQLVPWLARRDTDSGVTLAQAIGPTFSALASAAGEYDDEGYWFRFPVVPGERTVAPLPCQTYLTDPTHVEKLRCESLGAVLERLTGTPPR